MKEIVVSAPGKVLLLGGYSVLERPNIALSLAVNNRVVVKIKNHQENKIIINIPQYPLTISGNFINHNLILNKKLTTEEDKFLRFVKAGLEINLQYLEYKTKKYFAGLEITIINDKLFGFNNTKTGLGSSAALVASLTAGLFLNYNLDIKQHQNLIHNLAQYIHFNVQGKLGSGFDVGTAIFGSQIYTRFSSNIFSNFPPNPDIIILAKKIEENWDYIIKPFSFPQCFFPVI